MRRSAGAAARPLGAAEAAVLFERVFGEATGILLAVSGGPDSMALMGLARRWGGRPLAAATVDHGLRAASAEEARLVAAAASGHGVPHRVIRWKGEKPPTGLQAAARAARYDLLAAEAARLGFSHVATAHHVDDQAETVLMRLAAGSGLAGLAGMRIASDRNGVVLARPLLGLPKVRLIATCAAFGLPFAEDPSNADPRFGRARLRTALPSLEREGLTPARLARLAERAARADDALRRMAQAALAEAAPAPVGEGVRLDWRRLAAEPAEIRLRALSQALADDAASEAPLRLERLEALLAALDAAFAAGRRLRRSIADRIVTLGVDGSLALAPAPPRRRGLG